MPETCVPTCTVVTASSVPLAETDATIEPRDTAAVATSGDAVPRRA